MLAGSQLPHANKLIERVLNRGFHAQNPFLGNTQAAKNSHIVVEPGGDLDSCFTQLLRGGKYRFRR